IENLLVAAHHPEHLARNPLLSCRIMLDGVAIALKRIDDSLKGVQGVRKARLVAALANQIPGSELPSLDGECECKQDEAADYDTTHQRARPASPCARHQMP